MQSGMALASPGRSATGPGPLPSPLHPLGTKPSSGLMRPTRSRVSEPLADLEVGVSQHFLSELSYFQAGRWARPLLLVCVRALDSDWTPLAPSLGGMYDLLGGQ